MPDFRFLTSASVLASHYSASASSFQFFPLSPHSGSFGAQFRSRFPVFLRSLRPISRACFPDSLTRLPVCFLSPFLASLPQLFHECLPSAFAFGLLPSDPLPFVCFSSGSDYSASVSSFPLFPAPPHSGFPGAPPPLSLPRLSPFFPAWFPMLSFPVLRTRLPVRFLSSYPASLPQLFHRCFPHALAFGLFPSRPLPFVRCPSVLTTQPSVLSFPIFPVSPDGGSSGASFLFRRACFHAYLPIPVLSFLQFLSPLRCFVSQALSQLPASCFQLGRSPLLSL